VPLTTIHQPCGELGAAAIRAMVERVHNPKLPSRDILLNFGLVVRESSASSRNRFRQAERSSVASRK
jgi:GntR family transcriptional regulator, arabinose operon transcriptional repressor